MQKVHKCGKKGLIILTALCANSVVAITEKTQSPGRIIHNIKSNLPIEEPKRTKSFALNLSNIQAFDEISKYKKLSIMNKRIEKGNCFISQNQFVSTTVKRVLETILANPSIESSDDETFDFIPKGVEFAMDNCTTHHVCNDKTLFVGSIKLIMML